MILSAQTIRATRIITPFCERTTEHGVTYGISAAGYDIRVDQDIEISYGRFVLASSVEHFNMPDNVLGMVKDKSSWARRGLVLQNTVIEPGWRGYLTLELSNYGDELIHIQRLTGIAQIIFMWLDEPTAQPYAGKYQNAVRGPQKAICR